MRSRFETPGTGILAAALVSFALPLAAHAAGFALERYEPSPAGSTFLAVEAPWYLETRPLALAFTIDYAHDPLLGGSYDTTGYFHSQGSIISGQTTGHFDLAVAPLPFLQLNATLPVTLAESGRGAFGIAQLTSAAAGDPRIGAAVRLLGDLERDPFSLHLSGSIWIPIGAENSHAGDVHARGEVKAIAGGMLFDGRFQWAGNAGVLSRPESSLTDNLGGPGSADDELRLSAGATYLDLQNHIRVGPELDFATTIDGPRPADRDTTHLELFVGASVTIAGLVRIGPGIGAGIVRGVGTPDVRVLLRIAYAPEASAPEKLPPPPVMIPPPPPPPPPPPDRDGDGVPDRDDLCPDVPAGLTPDPARPGCPAPPPPPAPAELPLPVIPPPAPAPVLKIVFPTAQDEVLPIGCSQSPRYPEGNRLATITFLVNEDKLSAVAKAALTPIAEALAAQPEARVDISAYTDPSGSAAGNLNLAARRARSVESLFLAHHVAKDQLVIQSGDSRPRCPSDTAEQRAADRRADVTLETP